MYELRTTKSYRKAFKRISRHKDFDRSTLESVIESLRASKALSTRFRDHQLTGRLKDFRECHVSSDILLVYQRHEDVLVLVLVDIGSHSSLFK